MKKESQKHPFVSVVMPVRNEAEFIERSLLAVFTQRYPTDSMEIVIADGFSTDETRTLIERLRATTNIAIHIVDNPEKIAPSGLNRAIAKAKGEIIVRVDGHCEIEPNYVVNCVKYLEEGKADGVGGPIETLGETIQAQAIAIGMSSTFGVGGSAFRTINDREMYVDTVAFPGYKREILEKAGPFNEELVRNQDDEFNYRIRKLGGRILLAPDIRSQYYSRSSFKSLWRQYFQYGYWKVRVFQMHPRQMSLRQFIPFIFVATLFILLVFSIFTSFGKFALLGVVSLYLFAASLATIQSAKRINLVGLPFVLLSFPILHLSYGSGFGVGLFAFRKKWRQTRKKSVGTETFQS
jgi:succinoglycan biosynthesis protein ExoA